MRAFRPRDLTIVLVALAAVAVLTAASMFLAPPTEGGANGSSYSSAPRGARAAFLTLKQLGYRVERSFEPVTALNRDPARTLLVILDPQEPSSRQDRRALQQFLERGGVVVAAGRSGIAFLGGRDVHGPPFEKREYRPAAANELTRDIGTIEIEREADNTGLKGYVPLFGSDTDAPVRTARIGRGLAIAMSGATPFANDWIARHDNLVLLLNVVGDAGDRTIVWDEKYHGHARSIWSYLARTPLVWALAQLGVVALVAAATFTRRRGPIRAAVVEPRTSPMEFVDTMGALYAQARAGEASVAAARARLRRMLTEACRLPAGCGDDVLARAGAGRAHMDAGTLRELLREDLGEAGGALETVQRVQEVSAALARQRRGA